MTSDVDQSSQLELCLREATNTAMKRVMDKWSAERLNKCFPELSAEKPQDLAHVRESCLRDFEQKFNSRFERLMQDFDLNAGLKRLEAENAKTSPNGAQSIPERLQNALGPVQAEEREQLQQKLSKLIAEQEQIRHELQQELDRMDSLTQQLGDASAAPQQSLPASLQRAVDIMNSAVDGKSKKTIADIVQEALEQSDMS